MDEVALGLQWTKESYENLYVSYNVSTEPEIDATLNCNFDCQYSR